MKTRKFIPSLRTQIFLVFLLLLFLAIIFTRSFFIKSFEPFLQRLSSSHTDVQLNDIYRKYSPHISSEESDNFSRDLETLMVEQKQIDLAVLIYRQRIAAYSIYIAVFVLLSVLLVFLLTISLITRPLRRLQNATQDLMAGKTDIQIRENRFSPLNDLIVSFNTMVRELETQRRRAIEAEKQVVWREIARVMAHEIKNPLTPIKLTVERLAMKLAEKPDMVTDILSDSLNIIKEEADNLQALVNRFRNFASLPQATLEQYPIDIQLKEIISAYSAEYEINLHIPESPPPVFADRIQMKQVLVNLIQNAIQARDDSNVILDISLLKQNESIIITLKDNGSGISPDNLEKIFEPYFTTKRKGTGLGLAIVKRIIENHGGSIVVDCSSGRGTTIIISLPTSQTLGS